MLKLFSEENKTHFFSSLMPATIFGIASGALSAVVVSLFQWGANLAVSTGEAFFMLLRNLPFLLLLIIPLFTILSFFLSRLYRRYPQVQGGGIPTAVGAMRGIFFLKSLPNLLGVFFLSLLSFFFGIPLGTEGPSVQMGAAVGGEIVKKCPKKWHAWERFSITGGASAGFSVATGAPLSGILFSIEEAHGRISPLIVFTALWSVLSAGVVKSILAPLLGVKETLFSLPSMAKLQTPMLLLVFFSALLFAVFAVLFLKFSAALDRLFATRLAKFSLEVKLFVIFLFTLLFGLISFSFVSTGHHFTIGLFENKFPFLFVLAALLVRSLLTVSANRAGITGGIFLPLIAIGAAFAALVGKLFLLAGLGEEYFPLIISLGICAAIAGIMKMPLTAVFFSVEALGLEKNLLAVILVSAIAYFLSSVFGEKSVSEIALERKEEQLKKGHKTVEEEIFLTVEEDSFAVGKEIRDIFWPQGTRVLSVEKKDPKTHLLCPEDRLSIQLISPFPEKTKTQLDAILKNRK